MPGNAVLLMTIGVGNSNVIEATLYEPLMKSARRGKWDRIVLLPSVDSAPHAELLRDKLAGKQVEIRPLRRSFDENVVDACFEHFDGEITRLVEEGFAPDAITADFTRGTKAMSAGLVMAAIRRGIRQLRYIEGERRAGVVEPGTERIRDFYPASAIAGRRLDDARLLLERGAFAASADLLNPARLTSESWDKHHLGRAAVCRRIASFLAKWDRFDYEGAIQEAAEIREDSLPSDWQPVVPPDDIRKWVGRLGEPLARNDLPWMSVYCDRLAADVFANAERAIAQDRLEDGLVRLYRVVELLGQAALFRNGFDSEDMPREDSRVAQFVEKLKKNGENTPSQNKKQNYRFPREQVARFLKYIQDRSGELLLDFMTPQGPGGEIKNRNHSILAHGYEPAGPKDRDAACALLKSSEDLIQRLIGPVAPEHLRMARWPGSLGSRPEFRQQ